jgi:hypothetical protein
LPRIHRSAIRPGRRDQQTRRDLRLRGRPSPWSTLRFRVGWHPVEGSEDDWMSSSDACRRLSHRRPCQARVVVHRLGGGPSHQAKLVDLGSGGVRLIVDQPMAVGEVVQLVFPGKSNGGRVHGRVIVGHAVHVAIKQGSYVVGIEFGWAAASPRRSKAHRVDSAAGWLFGLFSRRRKAGKPQALRKA